MSFFKLQSYNFLLSITQGKPKYCTKNRLFNNVSLYKNKDTIKTPSRNDLAPLKYISSWGLEIRETVCLVLADVHEDELDDFVFCLTVGCDDQVVISGVVA